MCAYRFPVGYEAIHPDVSINFQMNRFYTYVGEQRMLAELREAAPRIKTYVDLTREVLALAETALAEGRLLSGAYYLRLAEFYLFADDPRKPDVRGRFLQLIRGYYAITPDMLHLVKAAGYTLRAYRLESPERRGEIVLFGGFDSYVEEWWPLILCFRERGFNVTVFEGPGQGALIEEDGVPFTPDWKVPVGAILDAFDLDDVTLVGLSLGGGLAIRAAVDEPRVRRVIADDILTDFLDVVLRQTSGTVRAIVRGLLALNARALVDALIRRVMGGSPVAEWGVRHGMHVMGAATPGAFFEAARAFQTRDVSKRITQDVLLMAGAGDHFVPLRQLYDQTAWLTHARSITSRIFTVGESAANHCHVGNFGLALDVMVDWIHQTSAELQAA